MTNNLEILTLGQSETYTLKAEKLRSPINHHNGRAKWWLELIERATGMTWIIYCDTKQHAQACFKGMSMDECREWMDKLKVTPVKMYKKGRM